MGKWIELKLTAKDELAEALGCFGEEQGWACFTRVWPEKKQVELMLYFKRRSQAEKAKTNLKTFLEKCRSWGFKPGKARFRLSTKDEQSWFKKSEKEFVPKKISRHFVVKPTWKDYTPKKWEHVIEIDPQMAFGTGHHFTTRFCLQMLDKWGSKAKSVCDMGCGTGILSIAAAKNGTQTIDAFDNDPLAIKTAKHNSKRNHTQRKIKFQSLDLAKYQPKKYDLVFANIISGVLLKYKKKIKDSVKKDGHLFITGVIRQENRKFLKQFQTKEFELIDQKKNRLWSGFVFRRK